MKDLKDIIVEKLRINQDTKVVKQEYTCWPKRQLELRKIIKERLKKDKDADLNDIDVSQIIYMTDLFYELNPYDIKIDKWNVSNVKDMSDMFYDCQNFKGKGLENWDVSKVEDMSNMFYCCEKFNCDLSKWDVSNVKDMNDMFYDCQKFEGEGLENWDVYNVEDMDEMFYRCDSLKNKPSWYK